MLTDVEQAPHWGDAGTPDAWLVIDPEPRDGVRDIRPGTQILAPTWLHKARHDELTTHPEGDLSQPELGVLNTRSPARPKPLGLHRRAPLEIDGRPAAGEPPGGRRRDTDHRHQAVIAPNER